MNLVHIILDYVSSTGGSYSTVKMMASIVPSRVLSFTRPEALPQDGHDPNTLHIPVKDNFFGNHYGILAETQKKRAQVWIGKPDLIVCHGLYRDHVRFVREFHEETGTPYLAIPHGSLDPWVFSYRAWQKRPWMTLIGMDYLENAAAVVFATANEARKAAHWTQKCHTTVVPWPVMPLPLENKARHRHHLREKMGIPQDAHVALYLGRLHPMKNPLATIEAFARYSGKPWHLVIVGPEEVVTHEECEALARQLKYKHLHLAGPVFGEEKTHYYHMADAFVLLSERENFGNSVAEAMSAELPVFISDGVDIHDAVSESKAGWVLAKKTTQYNLAPILASFEKCTPSERTAMGQRGRNWVLTKANPASFGEAFTSLCRKCLSESLDSIEN